MCGRYFLEILPERMAQQFGLVPPEEASRYNIAPTRPVLALRAARSGPEWAHLRWGLVPHWVKDTEPRATLINARAETIEQKPSFRAAFRARRCIVPASGFYEWQRRPEGTQPYAIVPTGAPYFGVAGIWETWQSAAGPVVESLALVTTQANATLAPIHERMPVILAPTDYDRWLGGTIDDARALLRPCPDAAVRAYRIARAVNDARRDGPDLCRALDDPAAA